MPALANSTSIFPNFLDTVAYNLSRSLPTETSAFTDNTPFPIVFTASSRVFWLRPEMTTRAPSSCKRFAVARPMPLLPPVTTATFPSNLFMLVPPFLAHSKSRPCTQAHAALRFRHLDDYRSIWLHPFFEVLGLRGLLGWRRELQSVRLRAGPGNALQWTARKSRKSPKRWAIRRACASLRLFPEASR